MNEYTVIWYEDEAVYRLVDHQGDPKIFTKQQIESETTVEGFLETEDDIDKAEDGLRYAISLSLLEETYGTA